MIFEPARPSSLPKDARLVSLRDDLLVFETREVVLPGTPVAFGLVMEGHALPVRAVSEACLAMRREGRGYAYHVHVPLTHLPEGDRHLIALFISKGRGAPQLAAFSPAK